MQIDKHGDGAFGRLIAHPDAPAAQIESISWRLSAGATGVWTLDYRINGPSSGVRLPRPAPSVATDGLWQQTCAELFVAGGAGAAYREFNFAPSGAWAAYGFSGYRAGMEALAIAPPQISLVTGESETLLSVNLEARPLAGSGPWHIGLSMVIEEICGTKSYWALRHPPGKPDFHHRHCFALQLPPPERA